MDIDPRGARFGAVVSTIILAVVLATGSGWLLAAQTLVFAVGAALGLRYAPYGMIFRWLIRPRLGPPRELEAEPPPRFAQGVGAVFGAIGVIGYGTGVTVLGMAATAAALAAAFLNAAFGFCLGCEMYLMIQRIRTGGREGAVHRT
jgi:hypothetical protein